jgi:hypothetical protein
MHFEIPHLSVNFITSKIYMYAGVTEHPFYLLMPHNLPQRRGSLTSDYMRSKYLIL